MAPEEAERYLAGKTADAATIRAAADAELQEAKPHTGNVFKVELAKRVMVRAVEAAARQT